MAEGKQRCVATLGLVVGAEDHDKTYATVSSHVTSSVASRTSFRCKTRKNGEVSIAIKTSLPCDKTDKHIDAIDVVEIDDKWKHQFKGGYRNSEGKQCKVTISNLTVEELLGKDVYHVSVDGDSREIIKGKVIEKENAGDGYFCVTGTEDRPFAVGGHSGGIVAIETNSPDEVELVGMITSGNGLGSGEEQRYGRCLHLKTGFGILEQMYGFKFSPLKCEPSEQNAFESGMQIYFVCP